MKRSIFSICFLFFVYVGFCQKPKVCLDNYNNGTCDYNNLPQLDPCMTPLLFSAQAINTVPSGYNYAKKFEWFVNGNMVKSTTTPANL